MKSIIIKSLLYLIDMPQLNIIIQYILRPIDKHKQAVLNALQHISYSKVLDYGCGEGFFSDCFSQSKYNGYDANIKKIKYAKKKFVHCKFLSKITNMSVFDLFFFNNVLHHMNHNEINVLLNELSTSAKRETHIMIIELKPMRQHKKFINKIQYLESKIHYSDLRSVAFYKQIMQKNGFVITREEDIDPFCLLMFKKIFL